MAERHQEMVWTKRTGSVPPGTRSTDVEETNPYSGWPQRTISLRDIMNHECNSKEKNIKNKKDRTDTLNSIMESVISREMYCYYFS